MLKQIVYEKFGGKCAYCGNELEKGWQVDHAISKCYWFYYNAENPKAVNELKNLMPSCYVCNHYKRSHCVESHHSHIGFRDYMRTFHLRLAKLPKKTMVSKTVKRIAYMQRIAERYGITSTQPFSGKFYFENHIGDLTQMVLTKLTPELLNRPEVKPLKK